MTSQTPDNQESNNRPSDWTEGLKDDLHKMGDELRQDAQDFRAEIHVSHHRDRSGWIWGLLLILGGGLLLLSNLTNFHLQNWWALFILIPAFGSFADAWNHYRDQGRFTSKVRSSLLNGLIFSCISAFFLFGLSLGQFWPVLLIIAGLALLVNAILPN